MGAVNPIREKMSDVVLAQPIPSGKKTMVKPEDLLPATLDVIEKGLEGGLHPGAQIYISLGGDPVANFATGEVRRGVEMTSDGIVKWLSCVKPVCAVSIAQLWEQGKLEFDDKVTRFIPEFGTNDKGAISIRHLLTHTSGIKHSDIEADTWDGFISRICEGTPNENWNPGQKAGYSVALGWFVLAEIVRRIDGRHYDQYAREEIFLPLGMQDSWVSMSPERYESYGERMDRIYNTQDGDPKPIPWDLPDKGVYYPGGSARGPIRELGYFYEMLLFHGKRDRVRILSPQAVEALTARHRTGMFDNTFRQVMDWGLGFILDSKIHHEGAYSYDFGKHSSPRTFGHGGYQSSTGFADPEHALVVAWAFNGLPGERKHRQRNHAINSAIYSDLGLVRV